MYQTDIQWSDYTHNFWNGCQRVSSGCKFCYMYRIEENRGKTVAQIRNVVRASQSGFGRPLWVFEPKKIFTCSMSDFFIADADEWRNDAWGIIKATPHHTWQILTKRPENILERLPKDWGEGYDNVWLGVTVEDQKSFHRAITLAKIPAKVRFLSVEPLLEDIDLLIQDENGNRAIDSFHQVLIGGESGNEFGPYRYRPCEPLWIRRIMRDVKEHTKAALFVKQMGSYIARKYGLTHSHGGNIEEWPKRYRVREWPFVEKSNGSIKK